MRGYVVVWKEEDLFFFVFQDGEDYIDFMGRYPTLNFQGALMVMKSWYPAASFRSFNFSETPIWVKVEGIPLTFHTPKVA